MPKRCSSYGSDKPDLRIPPFHCVEDLFAGEGLTPEGLPLVAIRIPKVGQISRKERDELKAFGQERGLRVYDDPKRLDRDFPEQMKAVRERIGAAEEDLLLLAGWGGEPKGPKPEETVLLACGHLRHVRRAEVRRQAQASGSDELSVPVGGGLPDVRVGRRRKPLERRASSVHLGARRGSREAHHRSGAVPREIVRPGAERNRAGLGLDSYSSPGRAVESVLGPQLHRRRGPQAIRIPAGSSGVRGSAAWRHRAGARPAGDDPGGRNVDPRSDSLPQDRQGHRSDVRRSRRSSRAAVSRNWESAISGNSKGVRRH